MVIRCVLAVLISSISFGADIISFGKLKTNGTGCPNGSVEILATQDAFTLLFDSFWAEKNKGLSLKKRSYCFIEIPIRVSPGWSLYVESIDYRGFASLEEKTNVFFNRFFHFWPSKMWSAKTSIIRGPYEDDYFYRDLVRGKPSSCGIKGVLRFFINLNVIGKNQGFISLDSIDGVTIKFKPNRCK